MWLTRDGTALLVAEQGTPETPGDSSRIRVADGHREVVVDSYQGTPFTANTAIWQTKITAD